MADAATDDKLACFQAITGIEDPDLCVQILSIHNWDFDLAVSSFISTADRDRSTPPPPNAAVTSTSTDPPDPGLAWKLVSLPFYVMAGVVDLGAWVAAGALSRSLDLLGVSPQRDTGPVPAASTSAAARVPMIGDRPVSVADEAVYFVETFGFEYGGGVSGERPHFVAKEFMEALRQSQREFKLLFVYLHSPDHPDTPRFCSDCLCVDVVAEFINANFVVWGGNVRGIEGFKMCNSLMASRFPFCAVLLPSSDQGITVLQQIEGPKSPEEMILTLQQVLEENGALLVTNRIQTEERMRNKHLREEQDAAFQAALEADQTIERQRKEEEDRLEKEAAEVERKLKEEEEARKRETERKLKEEEDARKQEAREAIERESMIARRGQEIVTTFGVEPEKGPDATQVLIRFPSGQRKERRFSNSATIKTLYDYVDSLDCLNAERYTLVSNFPRVLYGPGMQSLTLKEAGLHPQASLFIEL